ncbi:MAG: helix-turn-helix domain-containing protein, partial [Lentisphaeria bacterium]|nr:helix-turn-helix domain-containing protein [Lentisphaeria bacterium]
MNEGGLFDDVPENAPAVAPSRPEAPAPEEPELVTEEVVEKESAPDPLPAAAEPPAAEPHAPAVELPRGATLGATLLELRRRHQLDIDAVAEATWIKTAYLEALENDAFSELPQMVYVLAYVKKLCEFYGVSAADTESLLTDLREQLSYEIPDDIDKSVVCREQDEETRRKLRQITIGLTAGAILLGVLLILG